MAPSCKAHHSTVGLHSQWIRFRGKVKYAKTLGRVGLSVAACGGSDATGACYFQILVNDHLFGLLRAAGRLYLRLHRPSYKGRAEVL